MRPEFVDGFECPSCQSRDTVALNVEKDCVGWCNCGIVWIIKNDIGQPNAADVELVYSFAGRSLEDAITLRNAAIDKNAEPEPYARRDNVLEFKERQT